MEALLEGKSKALVIGAFRKLLDPLLDYWGDTEGFVEAGIPLFMAEVKGSFIEEEARPLLGQLYQQVLRIRALYFRPITQPPALDNSYKELDRQAVLRNDMGQQGALWLASRAQQSMLRYLGNAEGRQALSQLYQSAEERKLLLQRESGSPKDLSLTRVNTALIHLVRAVHGEQMPRLYTAALAGTLLETLRENVRKPPLMAGDTADAPESSEQTAMLALMTDVVRQAELNDAKKRFARLNEAEKGRRFNEFRMSLARSIQDVAPFAPLGFEDFCEAVEAVLYPYPAPLEFVQPFVRPVFTNGSQSTLFSDCTTPQAVEQRYQSLLESRKVNPLILEIARAFSMHAFKASRMDGNRSVLTEMDLSEKFGWPLNLEQLKIQLKEHGH